MNSCMKSSFANRRIAGDRISAVPLLKLAIASAQIGSGGVQIIECWSMTLPDVAGARGVSGADHRIADERVALDHSTEGGHTGVHANHSG